MLFKQLTFLPIRTTGRLSKRNSSCLRHILSSSRNNIQFLDPQFRLPVHFGSGPQLTASPPGCRYMCSSKTKQVIEKRVKHRSRQRGIKELDIMLSNYADSEVSKMSKNQLEEYENFIEMETPELVHWLLGQTEAPPEMKQNEMFISIKNFIDSRQQSG